jgi:hypothetical protein
MFNDCPNLPEPKFNMSNLTFDEVSNAIKNNLIFADGEEVTYEIQCSDKILIATFVGRDWQWVITEK